MHNFCMWSCIERQILKECHTYTHAHTPFWHTQRMEKAIGKEIVVKMPNPGKCYPYFFSNWVVFLMIQKLWLKILCV